MSFTPTNPNPNVNVLSFLDVLFDKGESIVLKKDPEDCYHTSIQAGPLKPEQFAKLESNPIIGINPMCGGKKIEDVTAFRSFLVEFDKMPSVEEQWEFVQQSGMPWSTCTFSGRVSLHFVITLETPLSSLEVYRAAANWIGSIFEGKSDTACKRANATTRTPDVTRTDKLEVPALQTLIDVKARIPNAVFEEWLYSHPQAMPKRQERGQTALRRTGYKEAEGIIAKLNEYQPLLPGGLKWTNMPFWCKDLLQHTQLSEDEILDVLSANDQGRNKVWAEYESALDLALKNFSL